MRKLIDAIMKRLGYVNAARAHAQLKKWKTNFVQPGHYYSPLNDSEFLKKNENKIFANYTDQLGGIDFNEDHQVSLLNDFKKIYPRLDLSVEPRNGSRYYFKNGMFSYSDAIFLSCMMIHNQPKRIIEIGSGFSSALMLDINEMHLNNSVALTFIEPYPEERLNKLVRQSDKCIIRKEFVQDTEMKIFSELQENDILFIDSSHVSKAGSDVNHLLFNVLPTLKKGVIIHIHDVFYPFEYPKEWVFAGRAWNEDYLVRAFLQFNSSFRIELFTSYLEYKHRDWIKNHMALCLNKHEEWKKEDGTTFLLDTNGQSIYLRKV
jgi:predicted O-methyltransferase YrrM